MPTIDIIVGARPNFMKVAPIIQAIETEAKNGRQLGYRLIHTGQHYDKRLSSDFFEQLSIPTPHINLGVGSGSQAEQTAKIMVLYEKVLASAPSDLCLVVGDVTSTMACAITAKKLGIPVAHVEAGIRSEDRSMPEEINRLVTDAITDYFFTTSQYANNNLHNIGVHSSKVFFVGNTMIDSLLRNLKKSSPPSFWDDINLSQNNYLVLTLHRPSNVDNSAHLETVLAAISESADTCPVVFPVHPRTAKNISTAPDNIFLIEPQPYLQFIYLISNAKGVITDSGGITEETTVLNIPCMTLRDSTERPETVAIGTNELIGTDPLAIKPALDRLFAGTWKMGQVPEKWDGHAGERIVRVIQDLLATGK